MDINDLKGAASRAQAELDVLKNAAAKAASFNIASLPIPRMPVEKLQMPRIPTAEEVQRYASAGRLISRLAKRIKEWRAALPKNQQPVILAVLQNGVAINVTQLSEESHHGVLVEGDFNGQPCMILCHQSTLQLLCYVEEVKKDEQRREIGFHFSRTHG